MKRKLEAIDLLEKDLGFSLERNKYISDWRSYGRQAKYSFIDGEGISGLELSSCELKDIYFLKHVKNLKKLTLYNNKIEDISLLKEFNSLEILDLGNNNITDISPLSLLYNLKCLLLDSNLINEFKISEFNNLYRINIENNNISNLSIYKLPNLVVFQFAKNPFKTIFLEDLFEIRQLNMSNSKIENLQINNLPKLTKLNLRSNKLQNISQINNLPSLVDLDIDLNPIVNFSELRKFPLLEILKVKYNPSIIELNTSVFLRELYFNDIVNDDIILKHFQNKSLFPSLKTIGYKTEEIKALEKKVNCELTPIFPGSVEDWMIYNQSFSMNSKGDIIAIRLRRKEIENVSFFSLFNKLEVLDIRMNKIENLDKLKGLSELRELHLYGNNISKIPLDLFESLPKLKYLNLFRNPINNIPIEIFDKDENVLEIVKTYISSLQGEKEYLFQAKMILIGNGEVGKTSIRTKLLDKKATLPKKEDRTQGLEIGTYRIKNLPPHITKLDKGVNFDLSIWDFGGQGKYREVQQLFCSRKALYLFVTSIDDSPDNEDYIGFEYWLSMAKAYGYEKQEDWHSPIIHVVNKCDLGNKTINETSLISNFSNIHEFIKISCETLQNFDVLEKNIITSLPKISKDIFTNQFSAKWFSVKKQLEGRRDQNYISLEEYEIICAQNMLNRGEGEIWLDYLDRIGDLIYFRDNSALNNFIVLNPLWVKDSIYRVLDSQLLMNGILHTYYLKFIWNKYTEYEHENLLNIMLAYKFCYSQKDNQEQIYYIVPALLPDTKPSIPLHISNYRYELKFEYTPFIPAGTVNKLMVELNEYIYHDYKWKNGCILHLIQDDRISFCEIIEDWENRAVFVNLGGNNLHNLFVLIRKTLLQLLDDIKRIKFLDTLEMETRVKVESDFELPKTILKFGKSEEYQFLFGDVINKLEKIKIAQMKTIKIFLASSMELKEDREALRIFISVENDRLHRQNVYLKLVQWEYFLDAVSEEGLQSEYNNAIRECDIVLSLYFRKVGKYTLQEFEFAYKHFEEYGKPFIFTYFKTAAVNMDTIGDEIISLLEFKKHLAELKHFPTMYKDSNDLILQFNRQLEFIIGS